MIPLRDVIPSRTTPWITLLLIGLNGIVAIFVHAGWILLVSNLLALWLFGSTVEDRVGHARFLLLYVLSGAAGHLLQIETGPGAAASIAGASGAVAGVIGAYFVLFPYSRVLVLVPLLLFIDVVEVPAVFFLGLWVFIQLVSSLHTLGNLAGLWTILGGSAFGAAGMWMLRRPERWE